MTRILFFAILFLFYSVSLEAQWLVGVSYEIRDNTPKYGYGLRLERLFGFSPLPIRLGGGIQFTSFREEDLSVTLSNDLTEVTDISDIEVFAQVIGVINLGLVEGHIGIGYGFESVEFSGKESEAINNDQFTFLTTTLGVRLVILPYLRPFVEYRLRDLKGFDLDIIKETNTRFIFGIGISL